MQGESSSDIKIDTSVLNERNYEKVAWSDGYGMELLTEKSQNELNQINYRKETQRSELKQKLFSGSIEPNITADQIIQKRMADAPIFTSKTDYYSLNGIEPNPKTGIGFQIGLFVLLGLIGYLLARYHIKIRKGKEHNVLNNNHTV